MKSYLTSQVAPLARFLVILLFVTASLGSARADVYFEAEDHENSTNISPIEFLTDPYASGETYAVVTASHNRGSGGVPDSTNGQLHFTVEVPEQGDVKIYTRDRLHWPGNDSWWIRLSGFDENWREMKTQWTGYFSWKHDKDSAIFQNVPAGTYTLQFLWREPNAPLDAIYVSTSGGEPADLTPELKPTYEIEAEWAFGGAEISPWTVETGVAGASGDANLVWAGSGQSLGTPSDSATGILGYHFSLYEEESADIWARVQFPDSASDSLYYKFGDGSWTTIEGPVSSGWNWVLLSSEANLAPGGYPVKLLRRDDGVKIDKLLISIDGSSPVPATGTIEAEDYVNAASEVSPMITAVDDGAASGGAHLVWDSAGQTNSSPADGDAGQAHYTISVAQEGSDLDLWTRCLLPSSSDNSFYWKVDGVTGWNTFEQTVSSWEWKKLDTLANLAGGEYTLRILAREDGARIDAIAYSTEAAAPPAANSPSLAANAVYVSPHGNDSNDGSHDAPWGGIQHALDNLQVGQTLYLRGGTYYTATPFAVSGLEGNADNWTVVRNYPGEQPILDGTPANYDDWDKANILSFSRCAYLRLEGLHVQWSQGAGIGVSESEHVEVLNCSSYKTYSTGIGATESKYLRFIGNTVAWPTDGSVGNTENALGKGGFEGYRFGQCEHFEVAHSKILAAGREAFDALGGNNGLIHHLYFEESGHAGIYFDGRSRKMHTYELFRIITNRATSAITLSTEGNTPMDNIHVHHNVGMFNKNSAFELRSHNGPKSNILFEHNTSLYGHIGFSSADPGTWTVENTTFRNNLSHGHFGDDFSFHDHGTGSSNVYEYNLAPTDPELTSIVNQNFTPLSTSPVVDAGKPGTEFNDPDGTQADIGAYIYPQGDYIQTWTNWVYADEDRLAEHDLLADAEASGAVTLDSVSGATWGTASVANGKLNYTPEPGYYGQYGYDAMTYSASSGSASNTGKLRVYFRERYTENTGLPYLAGFEPAVEGYGSSRTRSDDGNWEIHTRTAGIGNASGGGDSLWLESIDATGDAEFLVEIEDLTGPSTARAGLMMRDGMDADAPFVALAVKPNGSLTMQWRDAEGSLASETTAAGDGLPGQWLKLVREGATFKLYAGDTQTAWNLVQQVTLGELSATLYGGLYATSGSSTESALATLTDSFTATLAADRGTVFFSDDFEPESTDWTLIKGDWEIVNGELVQTSNASNAVYLYEGTGAYDLQNFTIQARIKATDDDDIGFVFLRASDQTYYQLRVGNDPDPVVYISEADTPDIGIPEFLVKRKLGTSFVEGQWHDLELRVTGGCVSVLFDGDDIFGGGVQLTLPNERPASGTFGMLAHLMSDGFFDDVTVYVQDTTPVLAPGYIEDNGIVSMEAENGDFAANTDWPVTTGDSTASNSAYVTAPDNDRGSAPSSTEPERIITYEFTLDGGSDYTLYTRDIAANGSSDSFYYRVIYPDNSASAWVYAEPEGSNWTWSSETDHLSALGAGLHKLEITYRESNYLLDKVVVQQSSLPAPTGMGPAETFEGGGTIIIADATDDTGLSVDEDSSGNTLDVLANDTGTGIEIISVTSPTYGTVVNNGGNLSYTPDAGIYGVSDSFDYTIEADDNSTDTATVTVGITDTTGSGNSLPFANQYVLGSHSFAESRELTDGSWELSADSLGIDGDGTGSDSLLFEADAAPTGDFDAVVQLVDLAGPGGSRMGLMLRDGSAVDAEFIAIGSGTGTGYTYQERTTTGAAASTEASPSVDDADDSPVITVDTHSFPAKWALLQRVGDTVTVGVDNADGDYAEVASVDISDWSNTLEVGVYSFSGALGTQAVAEFDNYEVIETTTNTGTINEVAGSFTTGKTSVAAPSGSDRLLVFVAQCEGAGNLTGVTYGGQAMTKAISAEETSSVGNEASIWYLDDAGISAATSADFVTTWSGSENGEGYSSFFLTGVDQATPLGDNAGTSDPYNTANADVSTAALTVATGDYSVFAVVRGNGDSAGFTYSGGYTERLHYNISSGAASMATQAITAAGSVTPTVSHDTANYRIALAACVFKPAAAPEPFTGWSEDFSGLSDGTDLDDNSDGNNTQWSVDNSASGNLGDADFLFSVQGGEFQARETKGVCVWESEEIDISSAGSIAVSADLRSSGGVDNSDTLGFYYILDGGTKTEIKTYSNNFNGDAYITETATGISGSTLKVRIEANLSWADESFHWDNVSVSEE